MGSAALRCSSKKSTARVSSPRKLPNSEPVSVVGARLGDHVDDAADRAAALRRPAVLQHLELLDRLVGEVLDQAADDVVLVVAAVDVDVELPAVAAAHGEVADAGLGGIEVADRPRLRHDDGEAGERAVEQRQARDLARRHDAGDVGAGGLDERRAPP